MGPVALDRLVVRQLWNAYDAFLLDCDGVLWRGKDVVFGVAAAVDLLKSRGKRVILVTNNSTKSPQDYVRKCQSLKINVASEEDVVSSSRVASCFVKKMIRDLSKVYMIGGDGLASELSRQQIAHNGAGPDHVENYGGDAQSLDFNLENDVQAVVVGFDKHISYAKLAKAASYLKRPSCAFIATNDDARFPSSDSAITLPGAGSIVHSIAYSSGRQPVIVGKPYTPTFDYIIENLKVNPQRTLMVGDWPPTDIKFAHRHGMASLLVLSGNATMDDVLNPADTETTPNFYCNSLYSLCEFDGPQ